jgi:hypothetical protein
VEPLEFTSSGGRGRALSRREKSRFLTFYAGIISDNFVKSEDPRPEGLGFPVRHAAERRKSCPIKKEKTAVGKTGL